MGANAEDDEPQPAEDGTGVLDRILAIIRRGERPDARRLASEFPELAGEIPRLIGVVDFVHGASQAIHPLRDLDARLALGEEPELAGFRIVREVARGGMGVVYEAIEGSLDRRVALKALLPGASLSPRELARFQREARTAASLDHPHIVAILSVGELDGVPYYAMPFIDGDSLAEIIAERKGERRIADADHIRHSARWAREVAAALAHAHHAGVIHRDVKPSNVLVDRAGKAWVTDFGLARRPMDATLTASGDLVGTLRYMAPEQARGGGSLDERTDVYSLGATLYELLTLRPPHDGEDREELLSGVLLEEPPRLSSLAPGTPRPLVTIVHKALAKHPDERYPSAELLAQDLGRFLDGRPILARPPSLFELLRALDRRHRVAVRGSALAVFALLVLAFVVSIQAYRISADREHIAAESERALRARRFLESVIFYANPKGPDGTRSMDELLDRVAASLGDEFLDDPATEAELRYRVGDMYWTRSRFGDAERELARAIELSTKAYGAADPRVVQAQVYLVELLRFLGRYDDGAALLDEAEANLAAGEPRHLLDCARAELLAARGELDQALSAARLALEAQRAEFGADDPRTTGTLGLVADLLGDLGETDKAIETQREIARILTTRSGLGDQEAFQATCWVAWFLTRRGRPGDLAEAETILREAIDAMSAAPQPARVDLAWARGLLADALGQAGRLDEADALFRHAVADMRALVGEHVQLAQTLGAYGRFLVRNDRGEGAIALLEEALALETALIGEESPRAGEIRALLCEAGG